MNIRHRGLLDDQQARLGEGGSERGSGTRSSASSGTPWWIASSLATRVENAVSALKMEFQWCSLRLLAR